MRRLPRRGGLERFMNSIWVGSLSEAWRSTEEVMSVMRLLQEEWTYLLGLALHEWEHLQFRIVLGPLGHYTPRQEFANLVDLEAILTASPSTRRYLYLYPYASRYPK